MFKSKPYKCCALFKCSIFYFLFFTLYTAAVPIVRDRQGRLDHHRFHDDVDRLAFWIAVESPGNLYATGNSILLETHFQ